MIPPIASRFVAGETLDEAMDRLESLNEREIEGILNLLGEQYTDLESVESDTKAYLTMIDRFESNGIDACISVKPSQLGLEISEEEFQNNLEQIVTAGHEKDVFVWIDMEDHTTVDTTLMTYRSVASEYPETVGVCLQANLRRTQEDLELLVDVPGKIRLVKGAYDPPAEIAYQEKATVDEKYRELLEYAFREFDGGIAVASHDEEMIEAAIKLNKRYGTEFEIQMLMGVREDIQTQLAADNDVCQYVPYGDKWLSYFYRRIVERKENLVFAVRAIFNR